MRTPVLLLSASLIAFLGACNGRKDAAAAAPTDATTAGTTTSTEPQHPPHTFGSATDTLFFSLERTSCFGACPSYRVTINRDGSAHYLGKRFAPREGDFTGQVPAGTMGLLVDRAKEIGFFDFQDVYDGQVTDLPSTIIRVNADGRSKMVKGRYKSPATFKPFAAYADSLFTTVTWTPVAGTKP